MTQKCRYLLLTPQFPAQVMRGSVVLCCLHSGSQAKVRLDFLASRFAEASKRECRELCIGFTSLFPEMIYICSHIIDQSKTQVHVSVQREWRTVWIPNQLCLSGCEDDEQKETVESNLFITVNTSFGFCDEITFLFLGRSHYLWHIWALYIKLLMRSCRDS